MPPTAFTPGVSLRLSSAAPLTLPHTCCRAPVMCASPPLRTGVLVSGGGRSLENICQRISDGRLTGMEVSVVICSRNKVGAIARAEKFGCATRVVRPRDFDAGTDAFSDGVSAVLDECRVQLVVLAGWMHFYRIPERYANRVLNIHPSLIPSFCGKGYYGHHVHEAVLAFGAKVSGCTVHFADNEYDNGPIIVQRPVPVLEDDDADSLAARVFAEEQEALPEAMQLYADGRLDVDVKGNRVAVLRAESALSEVPRG